MDKPNIDIQPQRLNELNLALKARKMKLSGPQEQSEIYKMYVIDQLGDFAYLESLLDIRVRARKLKTALESRGLRLREDSWLCKNYVNHGVGEVHQIVDTMELMQFLFTHTKYEAIGKYLINEQYAAFHYTREIPDEKECREQAKMLALELFFNDNKDPEKKVPNTVQTWYDSQLKKREDAKQAMFSKFRNL